MLVFYLLICVLAKETKTCEQDDYYEFMSCLYQTISDEWITSPDLDSDLKVMIEIPPTSVVFFDKGNYTVEFLDYGAVVRRELLQGYKLDDIIDQILATPVTKMQNFTVKCEETQQYAVKQTSVILSDGRTVELYHPQLQCNCQQIHVVLDNDVVLKVNSRGYSVVKNHRLSLVPEIVHNMPAVTRLYLEYVPIYELQVRDLTRFPNLRILDLNGIPLAALENGLLCENTQLRIFGFSNSYGNLKSFPRTIFNCSEPIGLHYLYLVNHAITNLPRNAFLNAAMHLKIISLYRLPLQSIHPDAFLNTKMLQRLYINGKMLHSIVGIFSLPSMSLIHIHLESILMQQLDKAKILPENQLNLELLVVKGCNMSILNTSFCNEQDTSLQLIDLSHNHLTLIERNTFQFCSALELIVVSSNHLQYLDNNMFSSDVTD